MLRCIGAVAMVGVECGSLDVPVVIVRTLINLPVDMAILLTEFVDPPQENLKTKLSGLIWSRGAQIECF